MYKFKKGDTHSSLEESINTFIFNYREIFKIYLITKKTFDSINRIDSSITPKKVEEIIGRVTRPSNRSSGAANLEGGGRGGTNYNQNQKVYLLKLIWSLNLIANYQK